MKINWKSLTPSQFEKLCNVVLGETGFTNLKWYGESGGDKGRDILADRKDCPVPGITRTERWMIQCKRYLSKKLTKSDLKDLMDCALEHEIDNLLLITTYTLSANLRDWLERAKHNYPFKTHVWEEMAFRKEVKKNRLLIAQLLPELNIGLEPLLMYSIDMSEVHLGCNEFDEVDIRVTNVNSIREAKAKAKEFIEYLQANGAEWLDEDET